MLAVKKTRTTAYHPAGNGQAENINKTIKGLLMAMVESEPETWDQHLGVSLMGYRSTPQLGTLNWIHSVYIHVWKTDAPPIRCNGGWPRTTTRPLWRICVPVKESALQGVPRCSGATENDTATTQQRQKEYFDRGVKERLYQPGDQVFLFNPQLKPGEAAKFHRKWKGPMKCWNVPLRSASASRSHKTTPVDLKLYISTT